MDGMHTADAARQPSVRHPSAHTRTTAHWRRSRHPNNARAQADVACGVWTAVPHSSGAQTTTGEAVVVEVSPPRALADSLGTAATAVADVAEAAAAGPTAVTGSREAAISSPIERAERAVRTRVPVRGGGGRKRRSEGRPECGRPTDRHPQYHSSRQPRCRQRCRCALRACGIRRGCGGAPLYTLNCPQTPRFAAAQGRELSPSVSITCVLETGGGHRRAKEG